MTHRWTRGWRGQLVGVLTAVCLTLMTGCYGKFVLVKKAYDLNSKVDNRYARSTVTAALVVFLIYPLSAAADLLILNVIEFWGEKNPAAVGATAVRVVEHGPDRYIQTMNRRVAGREMQTAYYRDGRLVNRLVVRQAADSSFVIGRLTWAGSGRVESYTVRPTSAGAVVEHTTPTGTVLSRTVSPQALAHLSTHPVEARPF